MRRVRLCLVTASKARVFKVSGSSNVELGSEVAPQLRSVFPRKVRTTLMARLAPNRLNSYNPGVVFDEGEGKS